MNPSLIKNLRDAGLPEKGAIVYAAVLEAGVAFPSKIAETTKLNRSTVYKTLDTLRIHGLVTEIERNKKICYQIEDPSRLQGYAKKQIATAEERYEQAKKILPELQGLLSALPNKPKVRFFEGLEGVIAVYRTHIEQIEPYQMVGYSNIEELMRLLPEKFIKEYIGKKQTIGITTRAIFPETKFSRNYNKDFYEGAQKNILVHSRYIPAESFPFKAEITMYGKNNVSIINFHENVLIGVIIEDPTIAGMMRMAFELAWKGAEEGSREPQKKQNPTA